MLFLILFSVFESDIGSPHKSFSSTGMQVILAPPVSASHVASSALVGALGFDYFNFTAKERLDELSVFNVYEIERVGRVMEGKMREQQVVEEGK